MVTSAKSPTKSAATPVLKTAARDNVPVSAKTPRRAKAKATTSIEPSLRFYHSEVLREKANTVLSALETQPSQSHHGEAIADLVTELIEAGMDQVQLLVVATHIRTLAVSRQPTSNWSSTS